MNKQIKKDDTFTCQLEITNGKEVIFKDGGFYRSRADHSLVSENGSNYFGFNEDVLDAHFVKV